MKKTLIIYVATDDDIRAPLFSIYEDRGDCAEARALAGDPLVEFARRNALIDKIPGFDDLHDLEMKRGMTIWNPFFQLDQKAEQHTEGSDRGDTEEGRWRLDGDSVSLETVIPAWLQRRVACVVTRTGSSYPAAVSLVEQMMALKEAGINRETTLCLYRMCVDEMPSELLESPVDSPSQVAQREALAGLVEAVSGVKTRLLYTVYSQLAEDDPLPAVLPLLNLATPSIYDQVVLEDSKTRVTDLEGFRERMSQGRGLLDLRGWDGREWPVATALKMDMCPSCGFSMIDLTKMLSSVTVMCCDECNHISCSVCGECSFWLGAKCPECRSRSLTTVGIVKRLF